MPSTMSAEPCRTFDDPTTDSLAGPGAPDHAAALDLRGLRPARADVGPAARQVAPGGRLDDPAVHGMQAPALCPPAGGVTVDGGGQLDGESTQRGGAPLITCRLGRRPAAAGHFERDKRRAVAAGLPDLAEDLWSGYAEQGLDAVTELLAELREARVGDLERMRGMLLAQAKERTAERRRAAEAGEQVAPDAALKLYDGALAF
jgi:hypothetical protein